MSAPDENDPLAQKARLRKERQKRWIREGEDSVGRRLAQIGVLGWIIVLPTLGGVLVGRWLDGVFDSRIFFTAPLLMTGAAIGGWSAWRWMNRQ